MESIELHVTHVEHFNRCPMLYYYSERCQGRPRGHSSALSVGSAMHLAGATIRAGGFLEEALNAAKDYLRRHLTAENKEQIRRDWFKVRAMIAGYYQSLYRTPRPIIWTAQNEVELKAPLINPATGRKIRGFTLGGTADAIIPLEGNKGLLYEMKTCGDNDEKHESGKPTESLDEVENYLRQSIQIPAYIFMAERQLSVEIVGTVIDIIKKPKLKPYDNKTRGKESLEDWSKRCEEEYNKKPDHYFRRITLDYEEQRVEDTLNLFCRVAREIRESERLGYRAIKGPGCKNAYGWCRFLSLCWHHTIEGYHFPEKENEA